MTEKLLLDPKDLQVLADHLNEWTHWRQMKDRDTADSNWDHFIAKSREKSEWEAGLASEIDHWESLHALQMALTDKLTGRTYRGHTRQ
ncbi:hypothetical protein IV54_GL000407 [Levilactobacillus paucivorans]|uniref:Uncharacterized protein n=1 Tax=Levilactobacillus paucivorans TaxID=616990 RepID=A0A0R2LN32_9LACO|nr:hypothetical protein [Levilactobacillus paucivorans]KRO01355.1 hypothetical protein IV54_GL000407 [Levilactobacillus paucivorans]